MLVLGEDVTNAAPMLALALRQSVRQQPMEIAEKLHSPAVGWITPCAKRIQDARRPALYRHAVPTRLDDVATATFRAAPDDVARLGFAVAHALDPQRAGAWRTCPMSRRDLADASPKR